MTVWTMSRVVFNWRVVWSVTGVVVHWGVLFPRVRVFLIVAMSGTVTACDVARVSVREGSCHRDIIVDKGVQNTRLKLSFDAIT